MLAAWPRAVVTEVLRSSLLNIPKGRASVLLMDCNWGMRGREEPG